MGTIVSAVLLLAACFGSAYVAMRRNRRRRREGKRVPSERAWWVWVLVLMPLLVAGGIWSILESSVVRGVLLLLMGPLISVLAYRQRSRARLAESRASTTDESGRLSRSGPP